MIWLARERVNYDANHSIGWQLDLKHGQNHTCHLLPELGCGNGDRTLSIPDVMVDDDGVAAAGRQRVLVPGQRRHARRVALERPDLLAPRRVPDLDRR